MKKIIYSMFVLALTAMTFASCEDVPAPYDLPSEGGGGGSETEKVEPKGSGTLEDPFNAAAANEYCSKLESGAESEQDIYVKGIVSSIDENFTTQFGNAKFYISEDGSSTQQFLVYRCLYLGNKKYTSGDLLKEGDEVIVCGKVTNYNGTYETQQNKAFLYSLNGKSEGGGGGGAPAGEAKGSGTQADPYNPVGAAAAVKNLTWTSNDTYDTTGDVYVKGKISRIADKGTFTDGGTYGNASFYISEDGTENGEFYCFRVLYLGNKKFESGQTDIKVGDEVIICGQLMNYRGNTPETVAGKAYLYSLNGKSEGGSGGGGGGGDAGSPSGDGTLAKPYNVAAACAAVANLTWTSNDNYETTDDVYVKGKISKIADKGTYGESGTYGNASFYIKDDGADAEFYCYRLLYLGNKKYESGTDIKVGDEVIIYGKLMNYRGNTPETVANKTYLYSLNGKTEGGSGDGGGSGSGGGGGSSTEPASGDNGNFEAWSGDTPDNWKTVSSAGNATLSKSTDAHGGSYSVKVGGTSASNKRISYKELQLKAGNYTMEFYVKASTSTGGSVRPGYVPIKSDGSAGSYTYGDYVNDIGGEWVKVTHSFELPSDGTYCVLIMNSKNPGGDVLIDDFTLKTGSTTVIK